MELDRHDFLKLGGALTFTIAAGGCATSSPTTAMAPATAAGGKDQQHLGQTTTQVFPINPGDKLTF